MSFIDTELAFEIRLKSITNIPSIAWPNVKFEPIIGTPFIVPTLSKTTTELYTLNGPNQYKGFYQIDIYTPLNKGVKQMYDIADSIKTAFEANRTLTSNGQSVLVQEIDPPEYVREDAWFRGIISIHYISYN